MCRNLFKGLFVNAHRNAALWNLSFTLLAAGLCALPFSCVTPAQSSPAAPPAPFHALPSEGTEPEDRTSAGASIRPGRASSEAPSSDMKCSVVEWSVTPHKPPALLLQCPPEEVYTPLRVYFRLSWKRAEDVPDHFQNIVVQPKAMAKFHWTHQQTFRVLLKAERKDKTPKPEWVSFNDLVAVYFEY
jgi:hypothetical protein